MVQMTVFITDVRYGDRLTQIRREIFGDNFPGSALITVTALAIPEAKVEIQGYAAGSSCGEMEGTHRIGGLEASFGSNSEVGLHHRFIRHQFGGSDRADERRTAARVTSGATCLSSSSHFPLRPNSNCIKPVVLPPGRAKLWTKPAPTGSVTCTNTMGTVRVARCSA